MQSDAPEGKVTATVKIDRRELLATIDWLEKAAKWFRHEVTEWRKTCDDEDILDHEFEDVYLKTKDLDTFMKGFEESVETLQALKP